jgi:hypothetical protein
MPPSNLKIQQTSTFSGGMNADEALELLPADTYRNAINIHVLSTGGGQRGIITNCLGTTEIVFDLPEGDNKTIGRREDTERNKFYWLNWNSNGFHGVYMYDALLNTVIPVLLNLTDTADQDILNFGERWLVLHIDVVLSPKGDTLFYFVNQNWKAKKFNVQKALDKSPTGYGQVILSEYINAYKLASIFPPVLTYFTDTTRESNYLYTYLFKASVRHLYDDGEKNNWSEFSTVPLPLNEGFNGNPSVSNVNNGLKITVETGSAIVTQIEIAIQISGEPFVSIIVLDKARLGISNDTTYDYTFYNDNASYSGLDQLNVYRAYSFLPLNPATQSFTKNSMVYGKGLEGFEPVDVDVETDVIYSDLFIPDDTVNEMNEPAFEAVLLDHDYTREGHGRRRNSLIKITVGNDVKKGNKFELFGRNGESDNLYFTYTATNADDAVTVAANFKQQLVATGRTRSTSEDLPNTDIWVNDIDIDGNVSFEFIWYGRFRENLTSFEGRVNPVSTATLKDTGQSIGTHKSGGTVKYGIVYWDEDTRRSNTFTSDACVVRTDFVTQTSGYKQVVHEITVKHRPPVWAKYWEVVRTQDLTYGNDFIHILIQKAIESQSTDTTDYVDLIIGSLYTYQEMYPNTVVRYEFEKNDRIRLIKKEDSETFYTFLETIVLDFKPVGTTETISEDVTTNETSTITIGGTTTSDNIGRYIVIDGIEREIIAVPSGTTYTLDRPYGTSEKYASFQIVDKRGILRVRKPIGITIEDNSLIEVYKPTQNVESAQKNFYLFGQKFAVQDWGTDDRAHTGNVQNQDPDNPSTTPAIVEIVKGTTYVRNRELPTNNQIPGTQVIIDLIEDKGYSDFYVSDLNDNGKIAPEDEGAGQIRFGSRLRYSSNYIEGTRINGLNDFDNNNREDYNDPFGDIMLTKYREGLLYVFKYLRNAYTPILANVIVDEEGQQILGTSDKLLNKLQYFAWEGGCGDNPESYASNQTWQYILSPNSGVDCKLGGNGVLPISEQFFLDTPIQEYIKNSTNNSGFVFGEFDRENGERILAFEAYNEYLYNGGFTDATFETYDEDLPEGTEYEITTQPTNGEVVFDADDNFVYTPDTDFVGSDPFFYRWRVPAGDWTEPKKECITVTPLVIPVEPTVYYNVLLEEMIQRDNCEPGYSGSEVEYVVPALKYSSNVSQEDADLQATDEVAVLGQAFANDPANGGTCDQNEPDPFAFTDVTGADVSTLTESDAITISSDFPNYTIVPTDGEYELNNDGNWLSVAGIVEAGDTVKLRRLSSPMYNTLVSMSLNIGGVSDTWNITTQNGSPTPFVFTDVIDKEVSTSYTSNTIVTAGYVGTLPISIVDGEYSINGGAFTSVSGNVTVGSNVAVRRTSSSAYNTAVGTTLTIGTYSDTYTITTRVANNVVVNYSMVWGSDPVTPHWNVISRTRNGVTSDIATIANVASGTLGAGDFIEGDTITVSQGAYLPFMWAPDSNVNLKMDVNGSELYSGDVTTQAGTQTTGAYVIASGVGVIDVYSVGSSTAEGYLTYNLISNSYVSNGEFTLDLTDNDEVGLGLDGLQPNNGSSGFPFNVSDGAGDLTVTITNNKATAIDYSIAGEGGYIEVGTIAGLGNISFADVPKGNVTVEVSDNNGAISCGTPTAYSGGQT